MYMKQTIQELMDKSPGASKKYGNRYMVHWVTYFMDQHWITGDKILIVRPRWPTRSAEKCALPA